MKTSNSLHHRLLLIALPFALCGAGHLAAQTIFTVNNLAPAVSTGAYVSISAPNALFQYSGPVSDDITAVTFGTDINFHSPGPTFGASDPGFVFNGVLSGSSIAAGTVLPISYDFTLSKNASVAGAVNWVLTFADDQNTTPMTIASGTLATSGASSATFAGLGNAYTFTNGAPATFYATLTLTYTTGMAMQEPDVNITMASTAFGGQGITLNGSAIPEPSTYVAIAGTLALGLAVWRRRQPRPAGSSGVV